MALTLKTIIQFPILSPPPPQHHHHRPPTEIRFSRWNNANAQKFIRHEQSQKQTEDELRFHKRHESANKITDLTTTTTSATTPPTFRSTGTPSIPSRPSIPGKKSKYSKPPQNPNSTSHPAFTRIVRTRRLPTDNEDETGVKLGEKGLSYAIPEAPFEFQYSYTETPKVKPIKLREPPIAPFGPGTMPRPWTGKKPLPASKKKIDFDSFNLPPPHKKGVKPVQAPGPFLPGSGPRYVQSREEILGEPLSKEEIDALIKSCLKSQRQLNMGRDGLTHNMLDNIHAHWKRRRVCKIKCKGVCTVDMDNVRQKLEEKTGGKVIYSKGGVIYLFRGRNYNFKTRPVFPLMLWKPITPVYPRLIQRVPEGLTVEEAREMRRKGRELIPITKLGKNGVYSGLVNNVREAFEACDLVRINCEGMNGSDYRKIGAKLKDLVPCVLISFEHEHILVWRGRDWKSMFEQENDPLEANSLESSSTDTEVAGPTVVAPNSLDSSSTEEDAIIEEESEKNEPLINCAISTIEDTENPTLVGSDEEEEEEGMRSSSSSTASENTSGGDFLGGVAALLKRAVDDGVAVVLEDSCLDADAVYLKAVSFARSAPPMSGFRLRRPKKAVEEMVEKEYKREVEEMVGKEIEEENRETDRRDVVRVSGRKREEKTSDRKKDPTENYLDVAPRTTLRVDELAKLLG